MPISEKTKTLVEKKFHGKTVNIGMSPALVIGHPTTLVVSLLLIPTVLFLAVVLPGNNLCCWLLPRRHVLSVPHRSAFSQG